MSDQPTAAPKFIYRGSQKHKNRPTSERKGTLCPEWTHNTTSTGYEHDPFLHPWKDTEAHKLFQKAQFLENEHKCFATACGIAFEAKPTGDGTWHGYPVPWIAVPPKIIQKWVKDNLVTNRQISKSQKPKDKSDIYWAIEADTL